MGSSVVVSFEGPLVKVLYGSLKKNAIVVNDALTLKEEQFDDFLLKEKNHGFIVVSNFKDFFHDTLLIPSTKDKFVKKLIEIEIRKKSPFKDPSFIYTIAGDKVVENRRMKEVSVFAVNNNEINGITDRFVRRGKVVTAFYLDIFSISSMIDSKDLPLLCVSETGATKNLFLLKNGDIHFARTTPSFEAGIGDHDIQNINMTVNYCRQTLRTDPAFIMLTGSICSNYSATAGPVIPIACIVQNAVSRKGVSVGSLYTDFTTPLSAFLVRNSNLNLLTAQYKGFFLTDLLLKYSAFLFIMLSILGLGYSGYKLNNIVTLRNRLESIRAETSGADITISRYESKKSEFENYKPFITSMTQAASVPDIQRFLAVLSELKTDTVWIDYLSISGTDILKIELRGLIKNGGYTDMQKNYENFAGPVSGLKGGGIKMQSFDIKTGRFNMELEWRAK